MVHPLNSIDAHKNSHINKQTKNNLIDTIYNVLNALKELCCSVYCELNDVFVNGCRFVVFFVYICVFTVCVESIIQEFVPFSSDIYTLMAIVTIISIYTSYNKQLSMYRTKKNDLGITWKVHLFARVCNLNWFKGRSSKLKLNYRNNQKLFLMVCLYEKRKKENTQQ